MRARLLVRLLPLVTLDHLLNLLLDRGKVEGRGLLHRWELDERLCRGCHGLLHLHKTPELPREEVVHVSTGHVVGRFAADRRRPLEWILTQVDDRRHVGRRLLARPTERLLVELVFEIIDTDRAELRFAEVEDLVTRRRTFAGQQVHLVVAVEMVLVGPIADLHALQTAAP